MTTIRKRGRPTGSGIDDSRFLAEIADLLQADCSMKPRAAMNKVIRKRKGEWNAHSEAAMLRRLQDKWKKQGVALRAEAQRRAEMRQKPVTVADIVEISMRINAAVKAFRNPVHMEKVIQIASGINASLDRILKPVMVAQKMMDQITEPLANAHRVLAAHDKAFERFDRYKKSIELTRLSQL